MDWTKRNLVEFKPRMSWSLSNCFKHYSTELTMRAVNFMRDWSCQIHLIYPIRQKCLKTKIWYFFKCLYSGLGCTFQWKFFFFFTWRYSWQPIRPDSISEQQNIKRTTYKLVLDQSKYTRSVCLHLSIIDHCHSD